MSQETLNTILSGIAALTGLVAVGIAIHQILQHRKEREEDSRTAEEQRRRAEEQLALARQQSEMRPDLEVSVALKPYGRNRLELGVLEVELYNSGKVAANDVHGWVHFEASKLSPYDPWDQSGRRMLRPCVGRSWGSSCEEEQEPRNGYYEGQFWENDRLLPGTYRTFRFYVTKMRKGESDVLYSAVSSEGVKVDGSVPIEVSQPASTCKPIPKAHIEFWLANPRGDYDDTHRATVIAGKRGRCRLESNVPVSYGGRPPYIHVRVREPGYEELVTQHYPERGQREANFDLVLVAQ